MREFQATPEWGGKRTLLAYSSAEGKGFRSLRQSKKGEGKGGGTR